MNPMPDATLQIPVVLRPPSASASGFLVSRDWSRDPLAADTPPSTQQREDRDASVSPAQAEVATEELKTGYVGPARRFDAWLRGSEVLDAPEPARCLDCPERVADALAHQYQAVRSSSYVPAPTPRLLL